ncbi:hypothetical protein [Actinomadura kijaniata]|uniref:hypothetical protein n=1 Tax=Actinomadura kijaniata TaxID=46161 RepID=UPI000833ACBA|nr:hypothetical protein [Actinomadura kijaniata]
MTKSTHARKWRREDFDGVPGAPEASTWYVEPRRPLRITKVDIYRDGGTGTMLVRDAADSRWTFCFDKFLGRLCVGAHTSDDDAAFVRSGSPLETELFDLMDQELQQLTSQPPALSPRGLELLSHFHQHALAHSGQHRRRSASHRR